jgi:phosphate transport system substrate-binding protein
VFTSASPDGYQREAHTSPGAREAPPESDSFTKGEGLNMKRALAVLALVGVIAVAAVVGRADASSTSRRDASITGAGSSFVFPLVSAWIPQLGSAFGYNVTYASVGSGAGIAQVTARTVDFGATDAPLSPDQFTACKGCVEIPWALSATSILYNLPGINCVLHLTGPLLAQIYLGQITSWDDAKIKSINSKCSLPGTKITPVYRSDNSGTTYNFTEYLSTVSAEWKTKLGVGVNAQWPAGIGGRGSSGVSGVVTKTEGALGYADVAYALKNKLRFASILNKDGKYATPGLRGIAAAAATLPKKISGNGQLSIVDPPKGNPLSYPICTFTYIIVPSASSKAADLRKMIYWAVTTGQKSGPKLLFQPLPKQVQAFDFKQIKQITG